MKELTDKKLSLVVSSLIVMLIGNVPAGKLLSPEMAMVTRQSPAR
ncbi:hypothetical protein [Serratia nevei]